LNIERYTVQEEKEKKKNDTRKLSHCIEIDKTWEKVKEGQDGRYL
jgi:hypothetical protein